MDLLAVYQQCQCRMPGDNFRFEFPVARRKENGILTWYTDFSFCSPRRSIAGSGWIRQWFCNDHPRRFDSRSRRAATHCLRIGGADYGSRDAEWLCDGTLHIHNESSLDFGHCRERPGPTSTYIRGYRMWTGLHDFG